MRYNTNVLKKSLFGIYFLFFFLGLSAQEPLSIHITDKNGFPDNEVYDLLQDNEGNIWISANKGLFKYDGKKFKQLTHPKKQGRSLLNLNLDERNRVWCNNLAGQFFYVEDDELKLFGNYQNLIKGIFTDFTFLNDKLVFKIKLAPGKAKTISVDLDTKEKSTLLMDNNGNSIGLSLRDTLYYMNNNLKEFKFQLYSSVSDETKFLRSIKKEKKTYFSNFFKIDNQFWILRSNKHHVNVRFFRYDDALIEIKVPDELYKLRIENIIKKGDSYYLSTSNGLYVCTYKNNEIFVEQNYLKGDFITNSLFDVNDNLWISTLDKSIFIIPNEQLKNVSELNSISALAKKNDTICYVGTREGVLYEYNKLSNQFRKSDYSDGFFIRSLSYNEKSQSLLYISDETIFKIDRNNTINKLNNEYTSGIKSAEPINESTHVLSCSNGTYILEDLKTSIIMDKRAYTSLYSKGLDRIYVSDVTGLHKYDTNYKKEKEIRIAENPIYTFEMSESSNGIIWLATYDKGVLGMRNDSIVKYLNNTNGLASNVINTIKADGNYLWVATEKGLQYYNIANNSFQALTQQDGINSFAIKHIEILGNTVLFNSHLGLFSFDKEKGFKNRNPQKPYIESVQIQEKDTIISKKYILPQVESNIQFNFNIKGYHSNQTLIYQYMLEGVDKQWITLNGEADYVKYNSLPDGSFKLRYRIVDDSKGMITEGDNVEIKVTLPFYKTILFWSIVFTTSLSIIVLYYRRRTKRLKDAQKIQLEKAEISRDLVFSQLENLRSQMNPHFIFNALNSIQDYIIINEKRLAREYLIKFAKLIRLYLDQSRKNQIVLEEELSTLNIYLELEKERFEDDFNYEIVVDENLNVNDIYVPSLLIQPYVENALKHGLLHKMNNKFLSVSFVRSNDQQEMICAILDNGIGREASAEINKKRFKNHVSFATSANQKRVQLLNTAMNKEIKVNTTDLYDIAGEASGTKVTINLPL